MRKLTLRLFISLAWLGGAVTVPQLASAQQPSLPEILQALPTADYADKQKLVAELAATRAKEAREVISAMLDGRLYVRSTDAHILVAGVGDSQTLTDPLTGQSAGSADQDGLDKVGSNNQLRKALRGALAQFDLASPDVAVRLAAVKEMLGSLDEDTAGMLRQRLTQEPDAAVRTQIDLGLALHDLDSTEAAKRLTAVRTLTSSLNSDVFNRLAAMVEKAPDGSYGESDDQVRNAAAAALRSIKTRRTLYSGVETLFFGLSLGSVLVLSAIGLSITFGVMGVINMAHGELMMLGAYATYVVQQLMPGHIGASIVVAIPVAFMVSALAGVAIERGIVRFLYGRPLETLLATFGVSLILQQVVRDVFSANNRPIETPPWLAGSLQINDVLSITYVRLYIVLFTLAVFVLLQLVLRRTRLGLEVRAVSQNRPMAKAMGIRTEWVDAMTFGLGSGIAGVAGVALSQLTNVGPNLGQSYIVDSFMVVVFGGVANLWGTLVGGLSLGVVSKMLEPFAGAVLAKIFVLIFLILFIQRRPRGLFPQKGRAAEH